MIIKAIPSAPGYFASDEGEIFTTRFRRRPAPLEVMRRLKLTPDHLGYCRVSIYGKTVLVHHLILEAFVCPRPDGKETRHLDGDPSHNRLTNLAWGTPAENGHDKVVQDRVPRGSRNPLARLNESSVLAMRELYESGLYSQRFLAVRFGVSQRTAMLALQHRTWTHV